MVILGKNQRGILRVSCLAASRTFDSREFPIAWFLFSDSRSPQAVNPIRVCPDLSNSASYFHSFSRGVRLVVAAKWMNSLPPFRLSRFPAPSPFPLSNFCGWTGTQVLKPSRTFDDTFSYSDFSSSFFPLNSWFPKIIWWWFFVSAFLINFQFLHSFSFASGQTRQACWPRGWEQPRRQAPHQSQHKRQLDRETSP